MDTITVITNLLQENTATTIITAVVTIFSAISAVTGTPKEGTFWAKCYSIIDLLALNVLRAKDKGK